MTDSIRLCNCHALCVLVVSICCRNIYWTKLNIVSVPRIAPSFGNYIPVWTLEW